MAYGRSGEAGAGAEVRDQRSEIRDHLRILKFGNLKLFNAQFAILFAHIRSSLSVLDLPQRLIVEALADGVDQNFLTDPFDKCGSQSEQWKVPATGTPVEQHRSLYTGLLPTNGS